VELSDETAAAPAALRQAVAADFQRLLANSDIANALPGLIAEPERADLVVQRPRAMCW